MFENFDIIDLTHILTPSVPTWNGSCGFCLECKSDYDRLFRIQKMQLFAGIGTHLDAPAHRVKGGNCVAAISLERLIAPACVVDVSMQAHADYEVSLADIKHDEQCHGPIQKGALVIAYTGWSRFWLDNEAYRNEDNNGQMHFPAFGVPAIEYLLEKDIAGIAIDTLSPDCLDSTFPVHKLILEAGKYIVENVAQCDLLPARGAYVMTLPLRAQEATESPVRMVAFIPKKIMS
ncbi:MAG: cyclase family protein [Verrucomicrobia bacterium]|nr:cyclase family protein [Verrucomicrobiota bacterium]MBS0646916.1 cyclase family protein [Verrucomicrobiota bacterium]